MTTLSLCTILAALLYLLSGIAVVSYMKGRDGKAPSWLRWPIVAALVLHGVAIEAEVFQGDIIHFGFGFAVSAMFFFAALILFVESIIHRLHGQLGIILIAAAIGAVFPLAFPGRPVAGDEWSFMFRVHILLALAAYSLMTIATVHAVLMSLQNRELKRPQGKESAFCAAFSPAAFMFRRRRDEDGACTDSARMPCWGKPARVPCGSARSFCPVSAPPGGGGFFSAEFFRFHGVMRRKSVQARLFRSGLSGMFRKRPAPCVFPAGIFGRLYEESDHRHARQPACSVAGGTCQTAPHGAVCRA